MHFMKRTNHLIGFHCLRRILNISKSKPNITCLTSMSLATQPDGQLPLESVFENHNFLMETGKVAEGHFDKNEFSKNIAVIGYPGFAYALKPVLRKHEMIKPVFVIDTVEKQQMFQDDPMIPEHKRNNVFKYNITSFASGLKKTIIQENELLDTLENISGVTVFSEVHDLGFVKLLDYRLCNESGLYEYPINWFLAMPSAIYKNLTLISRGFYKVSFHALHKCTVKKMALTGTHSMHPVLLHVTPNYQLLSQLKVERKFFKVFLNQMGQKTSLILPFVESMVTDSTEVVRPLLDTQYTRVCDVHPTKLLEIFIALTNMPEFEGSMFKQILYKEQWNETKSEEEKSTGREP